MSYSVSVMEKSSLGIFEHGHSRVSICMQFNVEQVSFFASQKIYIENETLGLVISKIL